MNFPEYIYVGIKGRVVALDRLTGAIVWASKLKGYDFVNLVCDDSFIYGTTAGEAFCLDPSDGHIRWHNPLKGLGIGLAALIAPGGPAPQTSLLAEERHRREQASSSSTTGSPG